MNKLPKLSLPVHVCELPVQKKEIEFHPFVIKQEKSLLTSLESKNKTKSIQIFKKLIQDCVITEDFEVKDLNLVDFYYLILFIRMKSTGEVIEGQLECSDCKKKTEFSINLEESIKIENKDNMNITIDINDSLSLRIIPANIEFIFSKKEVQVQDIVASSIDTVIIKEKIYSLNKDFSTKDLQENVLDSFTKMDYDKISDAMADLIKLTIKFNFKCLHCSKENEYKTEDITSI